MRIVAAPLSAVRIVALLFFLVVCIAPAAARGPGEESGQEAGTETGKPSVEALLKTLDGSYATFVQASSMVAPGVAPDQGFEQVRGLVAEVAGQSVEKVLSGDAESVRLLSCLQRMASNPVMIGFLAQGVVSSQIPGSTLEAYMRTACSTPAGNPYGNGKLPLSQAALRSDKGDVVVEKGMLWLSGDLGAAGDMNGRADPGELVQVKLGLINRSTGTGWQASQAVLAVVDRAGKPCPVGPDGPAECKLAAVLSGTSAVPELSRSERTTVGPFALYLASGPGRPYTVDLQLTVTDAAGHESWSRLELPVLPVPEVGLARVRVDDDAKDGSSGNGNGLMEPGEKVDVEAALELTGSPRLFRIGIRARQYSPFLAVEQKNVGLAELLEKKPAALAGRFEFKVPTVEDMGDAHGGGVNSGFFTDRKVTVWLAGSACAGSDKLPKGTPLDVADGYVCPLSAPAYRFVRSFELPIVFGQVFLLSTDPPGATVTINDQPVGVSLSDRPLVFTRIYPVKNAIVYYTIRAEKSGHVPATVTIPVIEKDQSASDLTAAYFLQLPPVVVTAAPVEEPPPPAVPVRRSEEPPAAAAVAVPEPEELPVALFSVRLGAAVRQYNPDFANDSAKLDEAVIPTLVGPELGGSFYLWKGLYVALDAQALFSTRSPTLELSTEGQYHPPAGSTVYLTEMKAKGDGLTLLSGSIGPGYRLDVGPLGFDVSAAFLAEGVFADTVKQKSDGWKSMSQPEDLNLGARVGLGFLLRVAEGWYPYVRGAAILPSPLFDWSAAVGVEYRQ